ncbi:hypothetical protein ACQJBY_072842 [Aegilops geniculata]
MYGVNFTFSFLHAHSGGLLLMASNAACIYIASTCSVAQFQYCSNSVLLIFEQFDLQIAWLSFSRAWFLKPGHSSRACTWERTFLPSQTIWNIILGSSWEACIVTHHRVLILPWDPGNNLYPVGMNHFATSRVTFCMLLLLPWDPGNGICCWLDGAKLCWSISWDPGDQAVLIDALRILQTIPHSKTTKSFWLYLVVQQAVLISWDPGDMVLLLVQFVEHSWCFINLLLSDSLRFPYCMSEVFNNGVQSIEQPAVKFVLSASSYEQWDPGGVHFTKCSRLATENWHRLGGKPAIKGEGMSAPLLP